MEPLRIPIASKGPLWPCAVFSLSPAGETTDWLLALKIHLHFLDIPHNKPYSLHSFVAGLFPSSCDFEMKQKIPFKNVKN